jgi:hypothetical protein
MDDRGDVFGSTVYIPTHDQGLSWMGHRAGGGRENKQQQERNTGVLRSAQDDDVKQQRKLSRPIFYVQRRSFSHRDVR